MIQTRLTLMGLIAAAVATVLAALEAEAASTGGGDTAVAASDAPASAEMGECSATIEHHEGPPRFPFAQITSVLVGCGYEAGVVLRVVGTGDSIELRWDADRELVIHVAPSEEVLARLSAAGDVHVAYDPPVRESEDIYGELPGSEWPLTCSAGASQVIARLPEESRTILAGLSESEFREMRLYWGAMLARHFALYRGNSVMLESCGGAEATAGSTIVDLIVAEIKRTGGE